MKAALLALLDQLVRLLTATETTLSEFWGSTMLIAMGIWLCLPFQTFDTISAYGVMQRLLPEPVWGMIAIALGLFQAIANLTKLAKLRSAASAASAIVFGFVANLAVVSEPASLLFPICGTAAFVESLIWLRLSFVKPEAPGGLP